ncbi:uncharacterized protein G2W53_010882 [Senna tora]|uniref:Uncharacterized protein n=1 Tax=Senna tora TaxID=362788 RepID=A0A834X1V7_9FABA|nr:uncharacterized protein G2W53_010882 [Senna tora]
MGVLVVVTGHHFGKASGMAPYLLVSVTGESYCCGNLCDLGSSSCKKTIINSQSAMIAFEICFLFCFMMGVSLEESYSFLSIVVVQNAELMKELQNVSALEENLQNVVNEYPNLSTFQDGFELPSLCHGVLAAGFF